MSKIVPRRPKVGVLTFHRCINYGSYWQARSLLETIQSRGFDAVLLDHDSWRVKRAEWRCGLSPLQPQPSGTADGARYALKMGSFLLAHSALPRSRRFDLDHPPGFEAFDIVVVGSDEVWNLAHPWYGRYPLFFGDGIRPARLVSYAASFGSYVPEGGLGRDWAERLRAFDAISVRDEHSRRIVRSAIDDEPWLVLDPCLHAAAAVDGPWRGPDEPFVAVYGHSFSKRFGRYVRRWARATGHRLVSIGYRNPWADVQWLSAGPHDFARALARARAVATNFFHGCIFALRNARPFVCETSPYRSNKIRDLLSLLGAEPHLLRESDPPARVRDRLSEPPAPEISTRIENLRTASSDYLEYALAS